MKVEIEIELANKECCDGCPFLLEQHAQCRWNWDALRTRPRKGTYYYERPQKCIETFGE